MLHTKVVEASCDHCGARSKAVELHQEHLPGLALKLCAPCLRRILRFLYRSRVATRRKPAG